MKKTIFFLSLMLLAFVSFSMADNLTDTLPKQDSTIVNTQTIDLPIKPETGNVGNMLGYIICVVVVIVARILPMFKKVQDFFGGINSPLIQRWLSETSKFMIKLNSFSLVATVVITSLLSMNILTGYWVDILTTLNIAFIAIAGLTVVTTNNPNLQK